MPYAIEHVRIATIAKRLIHEENPLWRTHLATHRGGRYGPAYINAEENSGEVFTGIRIYNSPIPRGNTLIKDPDLVSYYSKRIPIILEVKWGRKDLLSMMAGPQLIAMNRMPSGRSCRIRSLDETFSIDSRTKFGVVSDFDRMSDEDLRAIRNRTNERNFNIQILDIGRGREGFEQLRLFVRRIDSIRISI